MLKKYILHNFKNHDTTELPMAPLTILTGINGAGKSSVIQSLLILRESAARMLPTKITLSGDSFIVGDSSSLLNGCATSRESVMSMTLCDDNAGEHFFEFSYPLDKDTTLLATENSSKMSGEELTENLSLFSNNFQYLSASRLGPMDLYALDKDTVEVKRQLSKRLGQGEYTVYFLDKYGNDDITIQELACDDTNDLSLRVQVEHWMRKISEGVNYKIGSVGDKLELKFGYSIPDIPVRYHSAFNSGYGLSYVLSIIVAVLSAKKGTLLLLENPEAHIHPSGQSALMELISKAAVNGVQIVIETHSDHIINGALVMAKQLLGRDNLSVIYFSRDDKYNSVPQKLEIEPLGRIINAPKGFCDQMAMDMDVLFDM